MHVERAFAFCNLCEKEDVKDTGTVIIKNIYDNLFIKKLWICFSRINDLAFRIRSSKVSQKEDQPKFICVTPEMEVTKIIWRKSRDFVSCRVKSLWISFGQLRGGGCWDFWAGLPTLSPRSRISDLIFSFSDPGLARSRTGIRIQIRIKEFQVFLTNKTDTKFWKIRSGVFIPDPRSWIWIFFHPWMHNTGQNLWAPCVSLEYMCDPLQCRGSGSGIWDQGSGGFFYPWIQDPGPGSGKKSRSGCSIRDEHPIHNFESLETIFG